MTMTIGEEKKGKVSDAYEDFLKKVIIGIREVSDITGIPVRKIRYWEDKGVIQAVDKTASARQFDLVNVKKIILIQELMGDGYSLDGAATKVQMRFNRINDLMSLIRLT